MVIKVVCAGRIKEKYLAEGIAEYAKRLGRYCRLEILQVEDEKTPEGAGAAVEAQIRRTEGERLLRQIRERDYCIVLDIGGKALDSVELSEKLRSVTAAGNSVLAFVIGGSLGLSEDVLRRADFSLSFSRMTFPHQLMRLILLEQIYRSFRIARGEPYHK